MRKQISFILLACFLIVAILSIYGICYSSEGHECKTYGLDYEGAHYQIKFHCDGPGWIGLVD